MKKLFATIFLWLSLFNAQAQNTNRFADSIRKTYNIPELGYAVLSADEIYEMNVSGVQRIHTNYNALITDRFHIGSNTKAITAFTAALLVEQKKIQWNTKFFDLFPELKAKSNKAYRLVTLQDLLTFRGNLPSYTYTFEKPTPAEITGNEQQQRLALAKYFLLQKPMQTTNGFTPSNVDYILAGLMLERAAGKTYKELVTDFGKTQGIDFGFDYPNLSDSLQPWGHDTSLQALPPLYNYKLNWLLPAGNINVSLPGYIKFIQLFLKGLAGKSNLLPAAAFNKLLYGMPVFSFGWFNNIDVINRHHVAHNEGNAGAFITWVQIDKDAGVAYVIFTNAATAETAAGIEVLMEFLKRNVKN